MGNQDDIKELLTALLEATEKTSPRDRYRTLRFVLTRIVDINIRQVPLQFSGLFAKINYLLTEKKADSRLIKAVSNARHRIRRFEETDEEQLKKSFPYDLKSIIRLLRLLHPETDIPETIQQILPVGELESGWKKAATDCLRVIVTAFDDAIITARADVEDSPEVRIVYDSTNQYLQFDYSYLTPLLAAGVQLNLVRPRQDGGKLYPEIIIYEPDLLIDISSIASGFKEYGTTPLTSLVNKISPALQNRATLLGDFASQLLDEELHGESERPYRESIADFCKTHSLAMATCEGLDSTFHQDSQQQKRHIHKAFSEDLPKAVDNFDATEAILEPSFTCEMLGLQGRMDFLQSDYRLLIEQKSGKAGFVPGERGYFYPTLTTPHYVQLLLYRALLHYNYNMPNEQIRPFLLYSKYEHPLLNTDSAPELLQRAFCLRNCMAAQELRLASDGFGILKTLRADDLNTSSTNSKLWTDYTAPGIEAVLSPIREASSLETAYQQVMLQFVQREFLLSKIGNKRKENSGFCARWHDSLAEKKEAGNIIDNMSVKATTTHVVCENAELGASNFRIGDIVTLFPYRKGTEPDCRKTMIHRATIESINDGSITLRLRVPQNNTKVFQLSDEYNWAMEHDFMDSSYSGQYRAIHSFLSASKQRRDLLMMQREPSVDESRTLNGDYGSFNKLQQRLKQAQDLFLIIGPPGTGKTSFGMLYSLKEELTEPNGSVAVMAFTNRAVDEICSKLVEDGIGFTRIGSELSCSPEYRPYLLSNRVAEVQKIDGIRDFIRRQRVIVGTTTAFNSHSAIFALRGFSLAIIDEASQILEPQIIGLFAAQHNSREAIRKFLLIGDHKQLPAVVQQQPEETVVNDPELRTIGLTDCRLSLFERQLSRYKNNPSIVYMLHTQGRMHEEIARFPNAFFYENKLSCVPLQHQTEPSKSPRVTFINVARPAESPSDKVNMAEAEVIADIISNTEKELSVGVIVPYRNQISAVREALNCLPDLQERDITIDTVERFQGSQRAVIIYGFTVQRPYQLDFLTDNCFLDNGKTIDRKLNVVMTRAMKRLFLVGNADLLRRNNLFRELIDNVNNQQLAINN